MDGLMRRLLQGGLMQPRKVQTCRQAPWRGQPRVVAPATPPCDMPSGHPCSAHFLANPIARMQLSRACARASGLHGPLPVKRALSRGW